MSDSVKVIAQNRKANFEYFIEEKYECGIVLEGTEVKSVRGENISFNDSFAEITNGELWLRNFHISEYSYGSVFNHNPSRVKKLLVHKEELKKLRRKVEEKGYTLIPLEVYLKSGIVKIKLGVCRGKKQFDKRESIKERDLNRELHREFKKENFR